MILDKLLQFDPAATAITVTADSTNAIDLLNARDLAISALGQGQLVLVVTVGTAFAAVGAATLTIAILLSTDNITYKVGSQTEAIPKANLTAGQVIRLPLPPQAAIPDAAGIPRYIKLTYTVATGPFTAGTVEADLVYNPQANNPPTYPAGVTVTN